MKRTQRIREGRKARLIAEVNFAKKNVPVLMQCVYRKTEQRKQYLMGWHSVTSIDINVAIMRANGTLKGEQQRVSVTLNTLRETLTENTQP